MTTPTAHPDAGLSALLEEVVEPYQHLAMVPAPKTPAEEPTA